MKIVDQLHFNIVSFCWRKIPLMVSFNERIFTDLRSFMQFQAFLHLPIITKCSINNMLSKTNSCVLLKWSSNLAFQPWIFQNKASMTYIKMQYKISLLYIIKMGNFYSFPFLQRFCVLRLGVSITERRMTQNILPNL